MSKKCVIIGAVSAVPSQIENTLAIQKLNDLIQKGVKEFFVYYPSAFAHSLLLFLHQKNTQMKNLHISVISMDVVSNSVELVLKPVINSFKTVSDFSNEAAEMMNSDSVFVCFEPLADTFCAHMITSCVQKKVPVVNFATHRKLYPLSKSAILYLKLCALGFRLRCLLFKKTSVSN